MLWGEDIVFGVEASPPPVDETLHSNQAHSKRFFMGFQGIQNAFRN